MVRAGRARLAAKPSQEMELERIYRNVTADLDAVEDRLRELSRFDSSEISEAVAEMLNGGGKRLRPALVLIAADTCNRKPGQAGPTSAVRRRGVDLAAAMELIHLASLIHDDVIDSAGVRRGKTTISANWGNKTAILVGDHVYSKAVRVLAGDGDLDVIRCVAAATCRMTESEMIQSVCRHDPGMTEEKYLTIIAGKTAALISCSCRIGAMLGEVRNGEADVLGEYGLNLGMAFQITDDLLDVRGDEREIGKSLGADIREGNLTLPFIYAMSEADEDERQWVIECFRSGKVEDGQLIEMRAFAEKRGGFDYSLARAKDYCMSCKSALESIERSEGRESLAMLADYVVERIA